MAAEAGTVLRDRVPRVVCCKVIISLNEMQINNCKKITQYFEVFFAKKVVNSLSKKKSILNSMKTLQVPISSKFVGIELFTTFVVRYL